MTAALVLNGLFSYFVVVDASVVRIAGRTGQEVAPQVLLQAIANQQGSVTLAENFVTQLAEKVTSTSYRTTAVDDEALETIRTFLNDTEAHALQNHRDDVTALATSIGEINRCTADEQQLRLSGATITSQCDTYGTSHDNCRIEEVGVKKDMDDACAEYHEYRKNRVPELSDDCITSDMTQAMIKADGSDLKAMETCLVDSVEWLSPLYELYLKCKNNTKDHMELKTTCDEHQGQLESCHCEYKSHVESGCELYDICYEREKKEHGITEQRIKVSEVARKADHVATKKIECYLDVFHTDDSSKPAIVAKCKGLEVDTSKFDVVYPGVPDVAVCLLPDSPCEEKWTLAHYESKDWHGKAVLAPCGECTASSTTNSPTSA